jgi:hypothetical protein
MLQLLLVVFVWIGERFVESEKQNIFKFIFGEKNNSENGMESAIMISD